MKLLILYYWDNYPQVALISPFYQFYHQFVPVRYMIETFVFTLIQHFYYSSTNIHGYELTYDKLAHRGLPGS